MEENNIEINFKQDYSELGKQIFNNSNSMSKKDKRSFSFYNPQKLTDAKNKYKSA